MKIAFFTGGTNGLGVVAATRLYQKGYRVYIITRSKGGEERLEAYRKRTSSKKGGEFVFITCDLSDPNSLADAIRFFYSKENHLDLLVNNAGIWNHHRKVTSSGIEETWQVNVLSPVYLIKSLHKALEKSDSPVVITTASALHQGPIQFSDIEFAKDFSGFKAYRQSKHCVLVFTRFFARTDSVVKYYCQHPGVVNTELGRDMGPGAKLFFSMVGVSKEKGARTLNYLFSADTDQLHSGEYYSKSKISKSPKMVRDRDYGKKLMEKIDLYLKDFPEI